MDKLDSVGTILTALSPIATLILGVLMKRTDRHRKRKLDEITEQVKPNGGSSLRDAVDRIEATLTSLTEAVASNRARIEQLETERAGRGRRKTV